MSYVIGIWNLNVAGSSPILSLG